MDPAEYPDLDVTVTGDVTRVRAAHASSATRAMFFGLAALAVVPIAMAIGGLAAGNVSLSVAMVLLPVGVITQALFLVATTQRTQLVLQPDRVVWWRGPLPLPRSGELVKDDVEAFRFARVGAKPSEGPSATRYRVMLHPRSGAPIELGTFGVENRAKQLLGLTRAWLGEG